MSIFQKEVLDPVRNAMDGKILQIPTHLERFKDIVSIKKGIYTVVAGGTGSGKTSLVDDMYVLNPYMWWQANKDKTDVTFKVLYRSMERSRSQKLTKWACWKLYMDYGALLDADTMLGYKKTKINEDVWNAIVMCREWADEMLDYVDIRDGRTTPSTYNAWIVNHALKHGTLFLSDLEGVYNAKTPKNYIKKFSENEFIILKNGDKELICSFREKDVNVTMRQNTRFYIPDRPNEITIVIGDHVGKAVSEPGLTTDKQVIDAVSGYNSDARDIFGYSPVLVSQLNRDIANIQRIKHSEGDLSPQIEDLKGSGNTVEDSDLVLSLFNPFRYKSYDDNGMYKGYNIRDNMVSPLGYNRYRLLSILKNSYGVDDVDFGLRFWGEVNAFATLPRPDSDLYELQKVYSEIQQGK